MRETIKPPNGLGFCPEAKTLLRRHDWQYSHCWNGNNRRVLPFETQTSGIARSGWRCYRCGVFVWDQSDTEFALIHAHALKLIKIPS